jgi:hypothetical protein
MVMSMEPQRIVVPETGIREAAVLRALGVAWSDAARLYGDVLGSPRDYRYEGGTQVFTREGVRRLAEALGVSVVIVDRESVAPAPVPAPPAYWWEREDL